MTLAVARAHAHQMPAAVQLLAVEHEIQMAFGIAFVRVALRYPAPAIPDHDGATAIFALRDGALEGIVFDRMIFDVHGQPLVTGIEARAAGYRPALHDAVELEPEVIM